MSLSLNSPLTTSIWDTETSMTCLKQPPSTPSPRLVGLQYATAMMTPSLTSLLILTLKLSLSLLLIPQRLSTHLTWCFILRQTPGLVSSACLSWWACVHQSQTPLRQLPHHASAIPTTLKFGDCTHSSGSSNDRYALLPLSFYFKALSGLPLVWFSVGFHYNSLTEALGFVARWQTVQLREVLFKLLFIMSLQESSSCATNKVQSSCSQKEAWQRGACKTTTRLCYFGQYLSSSFLCASGRQKN